MKRGDRVVRVLPSGDYGLQGRVLLMLGVDVKVAWSTGAHGIVRRDQLRVVMNTADLILGQPRTGWPHGAAGNIAADTYPPRDSRKELSRMNYNKLVQIVDAIKTEGDQDTDTYIAAILAALGIEA
jgi:hypothetical protein